MMYGSYKTHLQAWRAYRRERENVMREIDAIPCSANWMNGCHDCCSEHDASKLKFWQSLLRGVALSEGYHEMMHRKQLTEAHERRQRRELTRRRVA